MQERWPQKKLPLAREERESILKKAHYNVFNIPSPDVYLDLLTDSGTGRMSKKQWKALDAGDESYANSKSAAKLKETIREVFEMPYVLLVNQGRAAEAVAFNVLLNKPGLRVIGNTPFDTTRRNIEKRGGIILDKTAQTKISPLSSHIYGDYQKFLGNIDLNALEMLINASARKCKKVAFILITATCNSNAGQPVSMENMRRVKEVAGRYNIPVLMDLARYAENAYFIKQWEEGYADVSISDIVKEMTSYADGFLASGKKDALGNIGGFIGLRSRELAEKIAQEIRESIGLELVNGAGYGGMSGRDMEALNVGIKESLNKRYLKQRVEQVRWLAYELYRCGVPVLPPGGHAVFVDAGQFLPHLSWEQFPGHALTLALYLESGIRAVEIGSLMLGRDPKSGKNRKAPQELVRLAIPRRVYTNDNLWEVIHAFLDIKENAHRIPGVTIDPDHEYEPRHFAARFAWDGMY